MATTLRTFAYQVAALARGSGVVPGVTRAEEVVRVSLLPVPLAVADAGIPGNGAAGAFDTYLTGAEVDKLGVKQGEFLNLVLQRP